jgi:hypothetical protein
MLDVQITEIETKPAVAAANKATRVVSRHSRLRHRSRHIVKVSVDP